MNQQLSPPTSIYMDDKSTASTLLVDELDYFSNFLIPGTASPSHPVSPNVKTALERQRKHRDASIRKSRHKPPTTKDYKGQKDIESILPVNQKRIRVDNILLFIKEGYIIAEQDLTESVRALHIRGEPIGITEESKKKKIKIDLSEESPPHTDDNKNNDRGNEKAHNWPRGCKMLAGVAATVAVAALIFTRRKR